MSDEKTTETEEFDINIAAMGDDELVEFERLLTEEYANLRGSEDFSSEDVEVRTNTRKELKNVAEVIREARAELAERAEFNAADDLVDTEFSYTPKAKKEELSPRAQILRKDILAKRAESAAAEEAAA